MISVNNAKRLIKRAILANVATDKKDLFITPLISGKHGIGKSAIVKSVAEDLGGTCITIEGGTLKEGEITGLPYQYEDAQGAVKFRFLPHYAVDRIQAKERQIFEEMGAELGADASAADVLDGDENRYALNGVPAQKRIELLQSGRIEPVIVFIDEVNRTENTVYKELMNILLTKAVNGYRFPWWVFFVGAMNPSTQNSAYATNEMVPAQLDRFLKLKVDSRPGEWIRYGRATGISPDILRFIKEHPKCLSEDSKELEDEEKPTPSPRGWDMVDTILASEPMLRGFFSAKENEPDAVARDMKALASAKLGTTVATMYFASLVQPDHALSAEEVLADDAKLSGVSTRIKGLSVAKRVQTCDALIQYLRENVEFLMLSPKDFDKVKKQLGALVELLDPSTRLLFAQKIAATTTDDGNSLIEMVYDALGDNIIAMLDLSDSTRKLIEAS